MNDKYNPIKCAQYGRRLATRLCDQHFGAQPTATLDGPAVLKFTPIRQVNLLVIRQLLNQWQSETTRLRSAYFDFEAVPVQAALTQFMNVLSRHISLNRVAFEPLLAQAAADTLSIVADPSGSFQRLLLSNQEAPTIANLRDNLRYFDIDKAFYQSFIDSLPVGSALTRDFLTHRFELYHTANYKAPQLMQRLVTEFSTLLPLTTADLLEDGPVAVAAPPALLRVEEPAPAGAPILSPVPVIPPTFLTTVKEEPELPPALTATKSAPTFEPSTHQVAEDSDYANVPLHEKLKAGQAAAPALAETLRATAATASSAERIGPKVDTLREAISINQRFSFINELFNGENMEYHAAIQHLDSLPTVDQARVYVTTNLSQRYDWSRKEEHVNKLLKLIERKFA